MLGNIEPNAWLPGSLIVGNLNFTQTIEAMKVVRVKRKINLLVYRMFLERERERERERDVSWKKGMRER